MQQQLCESNSWYSLQRWKDNDVCYARTNNWINASLLRLKLPRTEITMAIWIVWLLKLVFRKSLLPILPRLKIANDNYIVRRTGSSSILTEDMKKWLRTQNISFSTFTKARVVINSQTTFANIHIKATTKDPR